MSGRIDNLLEFSDEVLLQVLSYLQHNVTDLVHASHSCTRLDSLLQDKSICEKLTFHWFVSFERLSFVKFLQHPVRSAIITQLNFNDLYWIPSSVLRNVALKTDHLKDLYVAGTLLSWAHLLQILKSSSSRQIQSLSYSWYPIPNKLLPDPTHAAQYQDMPLFKSTSSRSQANSWRSQIDDVREQLQGLKFLLLHIPEIFNTDSLIVASSSSLSYFVANCTNLEKLYIFSWPKTIQELKHSTSLPLNEKTYLGTASFPNLHTFVLNVMEPQRISLPHLISCILRNMSANQNQEFILRNLWLDYPLLERQLKQDAKPDQQWPTIDFRKVESCSLPLLEEWLEMTPRLSFEKCKTVLLTSGAPRVLSLNSVLERVQTLESFSSKAFNYRLDWAKLIARNPNLKVINVCEDTALPYPGFCLAVATLLHLRKLSLPVYTLLEIKDSALRAQYCDSSLARNDPNYALHLEDVIEFKRKRVGSPSIQGSISSSISGLNILTQSCSEIDELEIGFCKIENQPGKILTQSLFSICHWRKLTKLTLDRIPITTGSFLVEIAKSCKLESLRLSHMGSRAKCIYSLELSKALTYCDKLVDFRFEQNFIGNSRPIFKSLECCKSLRRVLVLSESNDRPLEEDVLPSLMDACRRLSVLYVIIGSTPKYLCNAIRHTIESTFKMTRPSLSVIVRNETNGGAHYPSVHYRQLVLLSPQVGSCNEFVTAES